MKVPGDRDSRMLLARIQILSNPWTTAGNMRGWQVGNFHTKVDIHGKGEASVRMRDVQNHIEDSPIHDKIQSITVYLKEVAAFPKEDQKRIIIAVEELVADPYCGMLLKGHWRGLRRLRAGGYRVLMLCSESSSRFFCYVLGRGRMSIVRTRVCNKSAGKRALG